MKIRRKKSGTGSGIQRYSPPDNGIMAMKVVDGVATKPLYKIMTARDMEQILAVAQESGHTTSMLSHAIENTKVCTYFYI
jgi:hypothetical protein